MKKRFKELPNVQLFPFLIMLMVILMAIALISNSRSEPRTFDVGITTVPSDIYIVPEGIYMEPESAPQGGYAQSQNLTWIINLVFRSHENDTLSFEEAELFFKRKGEVLWKETYNREYLNRMEWIEGEFELTTEYFLKSVEMKADNPMFSIEKAVPPELPAGGAISWVRVPFGRPWFDLIDGMDIKFKVHDSHGNSGVLSHSVVIKNYKQKVRLRLPFSGVWVVKSGNDLSTEHRRTGVKGVTYYAWDFYKVVEPGLKFKTDGKKAEDYYGYGEPILAAGDGVVVDVRNDIPFWGIGVKPPLEEIKKDTDILTGNLVAIDHGNGEYSLTCHLNPGSVVVKVGDIVKAGQFIARLGSSGNSGGCCAAHFNLMTKAKWLEGNGLPSLFSDFEYIRDKGPVRKIKLGNPMTGWFVRNIE